jgi:hypothetical protein
LISPLARPEGRASSSVTSTTVTQSPAVGTSVGDVDTTAAVTAAASSCCGPEATAVSRDGSPVAAALTAARGALDERRLVITGAPDLSALAGARAGKIGITLRMKEHKDEHQPLEIKGAQGKCCSPQVGEALLPLSRGLGAPPWHSPATPRRSRAPPLITQWRVPPRPVVTGAEDSTSRREPTPALSSSSSSSSSSYDDDPAGVPEGESPYCSRSRYSSLYCSRCSLLALTRGLYG